MAYKVLIVDNEPRILHFLGIALKHAGYDTIASTSGDEAVEMVRSARPDIVLLNIIMPGMGGLEVLQKVRSFSGIPVIAMSRVLENSEKAKSMGANAFLEKPFDLDRLVALISSVMGTGADANPSP